MNRWQVVFISMACFLRITLLIDCYCLSYLAIHTSCKNKSYYINKNLENRTRFFFVRIYWSAFKFRQFANVGVSSVVQSWSFFPTAFTDNAFGNITNSPNISFFENRRITSMAQTCLDDG